MPESPKTVSDNGWAMPGCTKRFHFFRGGMSLCRGIMFFGKDLDPDPAAVTKTPGKEDCKQCFKLRLKEREKEEADKKPAAETKTDKDIA